MSMFALQNGIADTAPAASTPGIARIRSSVVVKKVRVRSGVPCAVVGKHLDGDDVRSAENPGSTAISRSKLRMSRPAPVSSTSARAISAATRPRRRHPRVPRTRPLADDVA